MSASDYLWATQSRIITELAEKGNCVIVGRCADYILRDRDDCLNVFIHANDAYRAKRIVELYGVRDKSPQKRLEEKDAKRKVNYKYFTGRDWGKLENYHICLDSSALGSEACVKIITQIAKEK
jgi:cytidylate kinase